MPPLDLTGKRYGKLKVLRKEAKRPGGGHAYWHCICSCGSAALVRVDNLTRGNVSSCGKCRVDGRVAQVRSHHEASSTKTYRTWAKLVHNAHYASLSDSPHRAKPQNVTDHTWPTYELFVAQMGACPKGYGLRRHDTSQPWSVDNCYWKRTARRKHDTITQTRRMVTYQGRTQSLTAWCRELGLRYRVAYSRIYSLNWSATQAFNTDVRPREVG